jgi:hypothetical protein
MRSRKVRTRANQAFSFVRTFPPGIHSSPPNLSPAGSGVRSLRASPLPYEYEDIIRSTSRLKHPPHPPFPPPTFPTSPPSSHPSPLTASPPVSLSSYTGHIYHPPLTGHLLFPPRRTSSPFLTSPRSALLAARRLPPALKTCQIKQQSPSLHLMPPTSWGRW